MRSIAISKWILSFFVLAGCQQRAFNKIESLDPGPDQFLFTTMDERVFRGESTVTSVKATQEVGLRRFALRSSGVFLPDGPERNGTLIATSDVDSTLKLSRQCIPSGECRFRVESGMDSGTDCEASGSKNPEMLYVVCSAGSGADGVKSGFLIGSRGRIVGAGKGARVKPNTALETFRTGPIFHGDNQSLLRVEDGQSIHFEVDDVLYSNPAFVEAFSKAVGYWNGAAGRELISPSLSSTKTFEFGFRRSLIKYNASTGSTLARANSLADPISGAILSMRIDVFVIPDGKPATPKSPDFASIITHELGHALGMAHNFAASYDPSVSDSDPTTSVMDYSLDIGKFEPKRYDVEYMRYVYQGLAPNSGYLHCNDIQVAYVIGCSRYDLPRQTAEVLLQRITDFSKISSSDLSSFPKDMENLISADTLSKLQPGLTQAKVVGRLVLSAPGLFGTAIKHLSFDDSISPELKSGLVKALRTRAEYFILNAKGLSPQHAWWLRWLVSYASQPMFTRANQVGYLKALSDLEEDGFETPHVPDHW
jgi:hypothetical protein